VEANTEAIVRLAWSRLLGLPDDTLDPAANPVRTVRSVASGQAVVLRLWTTWAVLGPDWFHERTAEVDPSDLVDPSTLLRSCDGHPARLVGHAVLGFTDRYAEPPVPGSVALRDVPVDDAPTAAAALERACPPDDVAEVGLAEMSRSFVTLDDRDQPTSGAGYDEWQGLLGHLGVLTPPELRRIGWGTVAAALALNDALDVGLVAQCRVRTDNTAARRLARTLGFVEVGEQSRVTLA
jgi:ribosomal protein S18 acetylase RimI-like enzyme